MCEGSLTMTVRVQREGLYEILGKMGFSPFAIRVYRETSAIPWGETRSYQWVAGRLDQPRSQRAIGQALKGNPFPFIIPCHRVVRKDGSLGGFSCGKGLKKRLLRLEKAGIIRMST